TEKVWGVSTSEIRSEWAAQRIKGLSFIAAARSAFFGNRGNKITSLISEFNYPRYGPGQMWERMRDEIRAHGGEVRLNAPVTRLRFDDGRVVEVVAGGETYTPSHVISSLPLRTTREIQELGLARANRVKMGFVVRVHKAYPMYDAQYGERVAAIRGWLDGIPNLIQVGRNGLHRYNNSDHSMLTAMRAVENILQGAGHDIWAVNAESVYHEEDVAEEHPYVDAPETPTMEQPLA